MSLTKIIAPYLILALGMLAGFIVGNKVGYERGVLSAPAPTVESCADLNIDTTGEVRDLFQD